MANSRQRKAKTRRNRRRMSTIKQPAKVRVIEAGMMTEQGEPIGPREQASTDGQKARRQAAREKERKEYQHSGIPIGSDPRE